MKVKSFIIVLSLILTLGISYVSLANAGELFDTEIGLGTSIVHDQYSDIEANDTTFVTLDVSKQIGAFKPYIGLKHQLGDSNEYQVTLDEKNYKVGGELVVGPVKFDGSYNWQKYPGGDNLNRVLITAIYKF